MIPRRCVCGVHRYDRCPDHNWSERYRDDRMAPVWAWVFTVVGFVAAAVLAAGGWYVWQVIS